MGVYLIVLQKHTTQTALAFLLLCHYIFFLFPPVSPLAKMPSPVRNFMVNAIFNTNRNEVIARLSWIGPERPYGKIDHYKIVLSSAKAASLIGSKSLSVQVCILYSHCTTPSTGNDIHGHLPYEEEYLPSTSTGHCCCSEYDCGCGDSHCLKPYWR